MAGEDVLRIQTATERWKEEILFEKRVSCKAECARPRNQRKHGEQLPNGCRLVGAESGFSRRAGNIEAKLPARSSSAISNLSEFSQHGVPNLQITGKYVVIHHLLSFLRLKLSFQRLIINFPTRISQSASIKRLRKTTISRLLTFASSLNNVKCSKFTGKLSK